jgi:uncharacterized repeat protein (TIGR01451 family)
LTSTLKLQVLSALDSTLLPPRGTDKCAPFRGMDLRNPNAGRPAGCAAADQPAPYEYKWLINEDNTGDPNQASPSTGPNSDVCRPKTPTNPDGDTAFPANCNWPSVHRVDASPVVTQGDFHDWNMTGLDLSALAGTVAQPKKYLVSVTANGFEIGGAHITIPMAEDAAGNATVKVGLNPYPLPLGTLQVQVFQDAAPADGNFDATTEHGLAGFNATISDWLGAVSSDWYGNPICTEYERIVPHNIDASQPHVSPADAISTYDVAYTDVITWGVYLDDTGSPVRVAGTGGKCLSDADGVVRIPNLGPDRYSITIAPPEGQDYWVQTTTLEGGHDWDFWLQANDTGLDTEMVQAGEPVPWAIFGYVDSRMAALPLGVSAIDPAKTGEVKGNLLGGEAYVPGVGALPGQGGANGQSGIRYSHPLDRIWIALNDLDNGDQMAYVGRWDKSFDIKNVRDGTYLMSVWDEDQGYAFDMFNVTIVGGNIVDQGDVPLLGWFTDLRGHVFVDANNNGKLDPGEKPVPNFDVTIKNRTNNLFEQGQNISSTLADGSFHFVQGYPSGIFEILEFYNQRYKTTGVTFQADNDPQEHTTLTGAVDISLLPIIGLNAKVDIGVLPYDSDHGDNGGMVATVVYDLTRNELQTRYEVTEDYEPGIPNIPVRAYKPVPDGTGGFLTNADGSYQTQALTDTEVDTHEYLSEGYERPASCVPRDANGNPTTGEDAVPITYAGRNPGDCIESTMQGTTLQFGSGDVGSADGQTVDGNYGFATTSPGDYIVGVENPHDPYDGGGAFELPRDPVFHRPLYKMSTEADTNVFSGDVYLPQGADTSGLTFADMLVAPDPSVPQNPTTGLREPAGTAAVHPSATCVGPLITIHANPDLHNVGGSPYEGQQVHSCSMKLVHVQAGQSVAQNFSLWTDVPVATKYFGYVTDDVSVSTDPRSTAKGEVAGVPNVPVGLYDWANRLNYTTTTDYNGLFEVLMPSTKSYNCPVPAGPCPGMWRFVGNDPGQPTHPNLNYNPQYKTIAANFQAWPGVLTGADVAPTRNVVQIEGPNGQFNAAVICAPKPAQPQLFRVDWPFAPNPNGSLTGSTGTIKIFGQGFGDMRGTLTLTSQPAAGNSNAGTTNAYSTVARLPVWNDDEIDFSVPLTALPGGAYQLNIRTAGGLAPTSGITVHVLKAPYTTVVTNQTTSFANRFPDVVHVGPLYTLKSLDSAVANLAKNNPYTNWGQTNRPNLFTPTDPRTFYFPGPIQKAVDYAWVRYLNSALENFTFIPPSLKQAVGLKNRHPIVVVYPRFDLKDPGFDPNDPAIAFNPKAAYYENPVMWFPGKVQGVGAGGIYTDPEGKAVTNLDGTVKQQLGSAVDGSYFNAATNAPEGNTSDLPDAAVDVTTDPSLFSEPYAALWENFVVFQLESGAVVGDPPVPPPPNPIPSWWGYGWDGQQAPTEGEVFYLLGKNGDYRNTFKAQIDGFEITGGDQKGFPGNRNEAGGGRIANAPDENFVLDIQGGAVMVNAFVRFLQLTNNLVSGDSGASGAIRFGTPQLHTDTEDGNPETDPATGELAPFDDQQNTDARIAYNRVIASGGTSLGGAVALFNGSHRYLVDHNEFCGNFSSEYGGAISHFGLSRDGEIATNRIFLNQAIDEGGAVMVAGEPVIDPATSIPLPDKLSRGSGPVKIHDNAIVANMSGDDGGGIRFLQAGNWQADVYNNIVVDNISADEGGGISLDDAPNVRVFNNTVSKNMTTATGVASNGEPKPTGLSTGTNSVQLQACRADAPSWTAIRGRTVNNSNTFSYVNGPAPHLFTAADIGATLVVTAPLGSVGNLPAGDTITAVAGNGRSVTLEYPATATSSNFAPGLTFAVFRQCNGEPPQRANPSPFSNPLLFNDIFSGNLAGNWQSIGPVPGVKGIGLHPDPADPFHDALDTPRVWDVGTADNSGKLSPTNSVLTSTAGYTPNGSNHVDSDWSLASNFPHFVHPYNIQVDVAPWRTYPRFRPTAIIGASIPDDPLGDYHLMDNASPAYNGGAASKNGVSAPGLDIDATARPAFTLFDIGADEFPGPQANLGISKTKAETSVAPGGIVHYTITVTNTGPQTATNALVNDAFPGGLSGVTWTCSGAGGSSCPASGAGNLGNVAVTVTSGGSVTFAVTARVGPTPPAPPPALPALTLRDDFNRPANCTITNLTDAAHNWTQANVRINGCTAERNGGSATSGSAGKATWPTTFAAHQGAAMKLANATVIGDALILRQTGGANGTSWLRLRYDTVDDEVVNTATVTPPAGITDPFTGDNSHTDTLTVSGTAVIVATTTNNGGAFTTIGTLGATFASGDVIEGIVTTAGANMTVDVWRNATYVGRATGSNFNGSGSTRIGFQVPTGLPNGRIDDFKGGAL